MPYRWLRILFAGLFASFVVFAVGCSTGKSTDVDDDDDDDAIPPAAITDLRVIDSTRATITLAWTVPMSDASHGTAAWYDLRKSTSGLSSATFDSATQVMEVPPAKAGGEVETVLVAGLSSGIRYCFALKCCTDSGGWSEMSNLVCVSTVGDMAVVFLDANLESAVRQKLGIPEGEILGSDMESMIDLRADGRGIVDLTGLEYASQLRFLALMDNAIADLTPLSGLTLLFDVNLTNNRISDLSPLTGLDALRHLHLGFNQIADLGQLAQLPDLEILSVGNNPVTSGLAPLSGLTKMTNIEIARTGTTSLAPLALMTDLLTIEASFNNLSDIAVLEFFPELTDVWLLQTQLTDLGPLVANPGIGTGDHLYLLYNPLSDEARNTQIPALQARGVTVQY